MVDHVCMGELTVARWTRYGKDRYYVKDADDRTLGYVDALTGHVVASDPAEQQAIGLAVERFRTAGQQAPPQPAPAMAPEPTGPRPPGPMWTDLATNRPGQAARTRAEEELVLMRDKSRVGTWLARALDLKTDERAWRMGADGEETIGGKLEKLTKHGWHVLHSVPVGSRGSDIDHVVIGPGGVFTVNTKKHPGKKVWVAGNTIMVNGQRVPYVRNSEHEADRASRLLSTAVGFPVIAKGVLIFTTGTLVPDVTIKSKPANVVILDRMDVPGAFKRSTPSLTAPQVEAIFEVARRSTTWTS